MADCRECGKLLTSDEVAIYRRMIHREAEDYLCRECLAKFLGVPPAFIDERIVYFKRIGCILF